MTYVIGYERHYHKRIMTWKLTRMKHTRLLADEYTIPDDFDAQRYLSSAWGVIGASSGNIIEVHLRFTASAAPRLREGGYPNMVITTEYADGGIDVCIHTGTDNTGFPTEILPWVQSWGPRVDVIAPDVLRERWLLEAKQVMALAHDVTQ
jgi:predicted DNA-binding transcriptional regulator YafY